MIRFILYAGAAALEKRSRTYMNWNASNASLE
jgi:hypothetical protein